MHAGSCAFHKSVNQIKISATDDECNTVASACLNTNTEDAQGGRCGKHGVPVETPLEMLAPALIKLVGMFTGGFRGWN